VERAPLVHVADASQRSSQALVLEHSGADRRTGTAGLSPPYPYPAGRLDLSGAIAVAAHERTADYQESEKIRL
jgi:hypothetical protein